MTLFTDWTMTDPQYFWLRGALWGIVAATLLWKLFIPWITNYIRENLK